MPIETKYKKIQNSGYALKGAKRLSILSPYYYRCNKL